MKILHTADWHIGQFKGPVVDGVNLRSQDTVKCLEYMVQVAIEEKPDIVCVSGDIFHQEQVGPVRYSDEMITATNIITSLAHFSKYVIVMRGTPNHDGAAQFRVLERMLLNIRNVDVVTEPGVIKTPWADIACLPGFDKQEFRAKFPGLSADEENLAWTKYISDMVFALRAECEKTPILMAHYTVPGCNMESGQTSFFTNFEPVIPREALMAARYEAVLLGHIHRPQIIEGLDNVFYSGAINAMNFNDEGQDRGFWIHEFNEKGTLVKGHKCTTPYRQFHTITWDPDEAGDYIREGAMYLHRTGISEDVTDKIVRVRYSCTSEQKKALNIPLLQKNLYELGAFYVADIEAESTIDITNRGLLSEESDPRLNLKKWLEEKTFKNPDKIVELAEPIIAEAMKQSTTAEIHGVFKPVSISVRNYRNYKEESFDFSDISFCTINGVNGAGKSSLFMDAIVDCLFEETREGDCKAWIRGTEDPPQISEIREKCAEYTVPHLKDQGEAWGEVQKAISQYGYYRQEEALESLTPIVREAVKRLGFREICLDENQDAVRAHFFKIYSTLIERKTNDAKLPPSILEAKNKYIAQLTTHENAAIEQQHRDQIAEEPERATPEYIDMLMREHGFKR